MIAWTAQELAEMAAADAEIEATERITYEDVLRARELDRQARLAAMTPAQRRRAESDRQYRAQNRERIAANHARYNEAHHAENLTRWRAHYEANREACLAYQRAYDAAHREERTEKARERYRRARKDA